MLEDLNAEQLRAVTHPSGPLLVLAGAGSGKTRVLCRRLAWLVDQGVRPDEILALAYNNRAARELRDRAEALIPRSHESLRVVTFHAWAGEAFRVHGAEYGLASARLPVGNEDRVLLLHDRRAELELVYHDLRSDAMGLFNGLVSRIDKCRDNLVDAATFSAWATAARAGARPEREKREYDRELEFARVFTLHDAWLAEFGFQDFGAMLSDAIRVLGEHPDRLEAVRAESRHILVDEFQDTNFAQAKLLRMVGATAESLVVVGDDDQGIYRFRGASTKNIAEFRLEHPGAPEIRLERNYRSTQVILDAAHAVVAPIVDRMAKQLVAEPDAHGPEPAIWRCPDPGTQARAVASAILHRFEQGTPLEEQAILMQAVRTEAPLIVAALEANGIPHQVHGGLNLFDRVEVRTALGWLRLAVDDTDHEAALRVVADSSGGLAWAEAASAITGARVENRSVAAAVVDAAYLHGASGLADRIEAAGAVAAVASPTTIVTSVLDAAGLRKDAAATGGPQGAARLDSLNKLDDLAVGILRRRPELDVAGLVAELNALSTVRVGGPVGSTARAGVQVMTIHQSKGLEFDAVYVVGLSNRSWPGRERRGADLPDALMPEALPAGRTAHESERRRLAYVALTRARRYLVLSVPDVGEDGRGPVSRFVEEIIEALPGAPVLDKGDAPEEVAGLERVAERRAAFEAATLRAARAEAAGEEVTAEVRGHALEAAAELITARADAIARRTVTAVPYGTPKASGPISISPNAIVTYLTCPRRYRYAQVDKIRIPSGPAAAIGTAAHHALEAHYTPGSQPQSAEVLIERFARKMDEAGIAETAEGGQALHRAREHFPGYHRRVLAGGPPARVEYAFTLKAGQHSVHGRIDRVDFAGDGFRVIDYKTNRPPMQTDSGNTVLALYIAALGQTSKRPIVGARLDYILDGENRPVEPDAGEVEEAVRSAERVGDQVLAGAFDPAPGWHCNHCPYRLICPAQDR